VPILERALGTGADCYQVDTAVATNSFPSWDAFYPVEYVTRNYGRILPEDHAIIENVIKGMGRFRFDDCKRVVDVGSGPNFYPAMLLASLMQDKGVIELIEPSRPNRSFMRALLGEGDGIYRNLDKAGREQSVDTRSLWPKFEDLMVKIGKPDKFARAFAKARELAFCTSGSIFELPSASYDFASAYFVAESITTSKPECVDAIHALVQSVKSGGGFMMAFMVGSNGWPSDKGTNFPAVNLTIHDIRHVFAAIPGAQSHTTFIKEHVKARDGYAGMAIVVGKRVA
jgi:hypothetical protein